MYYVYVISSTKYKYLYVGLTNNLKRRISEHQKGHEKTTRHYLPFVLLHSEELPDRTEARKREKYLKSGCGKEWIKNQYKDKLV